MSVASASTSASNQELNVTLPSIRQIHSVIRAQELVAIKLLTGDEIEGKVRWIDMECICIENSQSGQSMMIWQQAIAFIKLLESTPRLPATKSLAIKAASESIRDRLLAEDNALRAAIAEDDPFAF